jgi:hypothetical protein
MANAPISYFMLKDYLVDENLLKKIDSGEEIVLDAPIISSITLKDFSPENINLKGTKNFGYVFFEQDIISPENIENAKKNFDRVITGSSWCEEILRNRGLENVNTIIQGYSFFNIILSRRGKSCLNRCRKKNSAELVWFNKDLIKNFSPILSISPHSLNFLKYCHTEFLCLNPNSWAIFSKLGSGSLP